VIFLPRIERAAARQDLGGYFAVSGESATRFRKPETERPLFPIAVVQTGRKQLILGAANGRGCVKTQNRPLEIVSRLGELSVEVSCLLTGRYRLVIQSTASNVVFEGDLWGETVAEFLHSLGQKH
jgi:hypothetical protein